MVRVAPGSWISTNDVHYRYDTITTVSTEADVITMLEYMAAGVLLVGIMIVGAIGLDSM